ncbi:hypothetical protein JD844_024770 [Phrynosoma platyrhinos]|uniref:Monocarboxylate transporter 10 n=1 Tax=Phrynosoma platyrhinos TaxID=52577 RepID=A0ABQ7SYV7_PHRPL|nr:hypothetical protein JD844_024770 [Phrynosoma platyrhinos]
MRVLQKIKSTPVLRRLRRCHTLDEINKDASFLHPPPDGGWGWVVVLAACTHSLCVSGFHNAFGVYMLPLLETFQSTSSIIAWIGSVSYAFIMIFGPISGKLLVKFGAIKVAIIGAVVVMFGLVCSSYTYDLRILFLTHGIIVGVGSSLASTPGLIMVSLYFTSKRSFATGVVMAGGAAGTFVQNKLHEYLIQRLGWRRSLRVYSGILSICIFAGFAYRPLQKHRTHPSVVEKFKTSPLRGFIVDLSLWKDRIFEVWVVSLGLAKFGFFIPFVHMIKLAGDLHIPVHQASYIMVGIGVSSMVSCLVFGKLCDIERIDRLYLNQASILSVGNYVLLPVLTFDLMGEEKMPVAWGFMMAVNAISCFGPPFAGAMYDIFGNYNIGFVVTGVCNIAAASILALIPWLKNEAVQSTKNYINASVCEITKTIVPWQSPTPSLGSLTSSYTKSIMLIPDDNASQFSKRFSMKSFKSILKSDATSYKSTASEHATRALPKKTERRRASAPQAFHTDAYEKKRSTTDLRTKPAQEPAVSAVASSPSQISEHLPHKEEDGVPFLDGQAGSEEEQLESITEVRPLQELTVPESVSPEEEILDLKQAERLLHRKEDGMAFLDEHGGEEEEHLEATISLKPMDAIKQTERKVSFLDEYDSDEEEHSEGSLDLKPQQTPYKGERIFSIPHRKEDGVAFLDEYYISDDDYDDFFESATDLLTSKQAAFQSEASRRGKQSEKMPSIPHRKEDGVAFLDEYDDDENGEFESATDLLRPKQGSYWSDASGHGKQPEQMPSIPHRKEDGVAFLDEYDDNKNDSFESGVDLSQRKQRSYWSDTSGHGKQSEPMPSASHRKEDGVTFLKDIDGYDTSQEQIESTATLRSTKDADKSQAAPIGNEISPSVKQARQFPYKRDSSTASGDEEDENEQSQQQK